MEHKSYYDTEHEAWEVADSARDKLTIGNWRVNTYQQAGVSGQDTGRWVWRLMWEHFCIHFNKGWKNEVAEKADTYTLYVSVRTCNDTGSLGMVYDGPDINRLIPDSIQDILQTLKPYRDAFKWLNRIDV